jgi:hypothetical protein
MSFATGMLAGEAFALIRNYVPQYKAQAQNAVSVLSASNANTDFIFSILDGLNGAIVNLAAWKSANGLDAYATGQGYPTAISTDCTAIISAAQNSVNWVVTNFPKSGGFLLGYSLNADGSRTPAFFTPAQTVGLQTALSALIATIS